MPLEAIRQKYGREKVKKRQLEHPLSELKQRQNAPPIESDRFRQLLRQELEKDKSRKSALHA
ncbi:hypothetical protein CMK14_25005 [Candidatus Poribacteria bacterium]|nr:hypothetical protein [Candidatus Poribacteria bacterium]